MLLYESTKNKNKKIKVKTRFILLIAYIATFYRLAYSIKSYCPYIVSIILNKPCFFFSKRIINKYINNTLKSFKKKGFQMNHSRSTAHDGQQLYQLVWNSFVIKFVTDQDYLLKQSMQL